MSIIIFIIILGVLIFVHELGHFLTAKLNGIRVDEFALGFPPRLLSYKKNGTRYSLNLIPFGGYVKIFGENPDKESLDKEAKDSFLNKSRFVQAMVLAAGVLFNLLFAWFLFAIILMAGKPTIINDDSQVEQLQDISVVIKNIIEDSPAERAGLRVGDVIVAISDLNKDSQINYPSSEEIKNFINSSEEQIILTLRTDNREVVLKPEPNLIDSRLAIGIGMDEIGYMKYPFFVAIWESFILLLENVKLVFVGLWVLVRGIFDGTADLNQVSGPVGIISIVADAAQFGFLNILTFMAILSINLAVINILPIPALDGGRLLFLGFEGLTQKRIKPVVVNVVNLIGFILLMGLMLVITFADIVKAF